MNEYFFTLPSVPPSLNGAYFNNKWGGRTLTKTAREWKNGAAIHLKLQFKKLSAMPINQACEASYTFSSKMRGDLDNRVKLLQDALEKSGIIVNDKLITKVSAQRSEIDGCEVKILVK